MAYNSWKLMDKVTVAVKRAPGWRGFSGYIVEAGDESALEKAKEWARERVWDSDKREYVETIEPSIHTFDNEGFTATILQSAGGSSQGGRLSFWSAKVEKDGVEFVIGVNDEILAGLIKSSTIVNGVVKEKVMFARKSGQPGLIHEGMQMYKDATADMAHKDAMKKAKKTSKWEKGGVYSSITQTSICLGEVWDRYEEYVVKEETTTWYGSRFVRTKLRKRKTPVKVLAWTHMWGRSKEELPTTFEELLKSETKRPDYVYFAAGKPPARAKTGQLELKDSDDVLLDYLLSLKLDSINYEDEKIKGRYVRELK